MQDHEVLELLLFNSIGRQNTNETAHRLIETFGSLSGVFDAPYEELCKVEGIGEVSASLIKFSIQMYGRYAVDKQKNVERIESREAAIAYLKPRFIGQTNEIAMLLTLGGDSKVLRCNPLGEGIHNTVEINIKRVVELALRDQAHGVILAHNHPGGVVLPSYDDVVVTRRLMDTLKAVNIKFLDHIIVFCDDAFSFADSKRFGAMFAER